MKAWTPAVVCVVGAALAASVAAGAALPEVEPKITDLTVFKDGHVLVLARGKVALSNGWCRTRRVPVPVLGTFWAFVADRQARVDFVKAGFAEATHTRPCMSFDEVIQANIGKEVEIVEMPKSGEPITHTGTLQGILKHKAEREAEVATTVPAGRDRWGRYRGTTQIRETRTDQATTLSSFVMLKEKGRVVLVQRASIHSMAVAEPMAAEHRETKKVREISLRIVKGGQPLAGEQEVGMVYLQKGIRWIPSYRIELLDGGKARLTLQGTIINDLADIEDAHFRLVVGVPSFLMKHALSPVALRERALHLSSYFAPPSRRGGDRRLDYLSNALMSQQAMPAPEARPAGPGGPDIPAEGQQEDLFLYHREGLSLKKGERAVVHLMDVTVPYEDIYVWEIPPVPPREMWRHINREQQQQLVQALTGARAMHNLRLTNTGRTPWTTGPAAIFRGGTPLGQQLLPYTSIDNKVDVAVTIATDLNTKKEEKETSRKHNDLTIDNNRYTRHTLKGTLTVTNFKDKPVRLVVRRQVIGTVTAATHDGKIRVSNLMENASVGGQGYPWYWWSWPWWWARVNSVSIVTWDTTVAKGKAVSLGYDWFYHTHP